MCRSRRYALSRLGDPSCGPELRFDPLVGGHQTFPQRDPGLPIEHLAEPAVVAVSTPHPLRFGEIVALGDALAGDLGHHVDQFVDGHQLVGTQVERVSVVGAHDPVDALYTVIYMHKGASLLAVAP